ncbi:MAG: exopolysaccharide biosynthesis polyprenyl glycosylphosphotransferase [Bacteroidales bacterium]
MAARYSKYIPVLSIIGDFILLNALFVAGYLVVMDNPMKYSTTHLAFYAYLNLVWFILIFVFGANKIDRNTQRKSLVFANLKMVVFFFLLFLLYFQVTSLEYFPRDSIKFLFPLYLVTLIFWKFLLYYAFYFYRKFGFNYSNVIILGLTPRTLELANYFTHDNWHGYRLMGFFDENRTYRSYNILPYQRLGEYIRDHEIHEVYISWTRLPREVIPMVTDIISEHPLKVNIVPDLGKFSFKSSELVDYGITPVLQIHPGPLSYWYNRWLKRVFDIILSLIVIIGFLSWFSLILLIIDLISSREGIFFRQKRTKIDGKVFTCLKYRSMRRNKDADEKQATQDDARITPLGRFLRKLSLDELPQFFNVLAGQMSVIGPRPHMLRHTEIYSKMVKRFMLRHSIKPGITGLAQVNGYRGEIRNRTDIRKRVENDFHYIENWSFSLDMKILFLTFWVLIRGQKQAF